MKFFVITSVNVLPTFCRQLYCQAMRSSAGRMSAARCGNRSAFTLIELMVVIVIIGVLTAMIIPEMKGSFQDALLRSTSRELVDVFNLAYSRAVSLNQLRRVRLDEKTGRYVVEKQVTENGQESFVPANDMPGDKGELDSRITIEFHQSGANAEASTATETTASTDESSVNKMTVNFYPDGTASAGEIL